MTQITDLTWQQLETASGLSNLLIIDSTNGLMLRLSALTTAAVTAKTQTGVVQALLKLRELAATAQNTVNVGKAIGERLAAFPPMSSGIAVNGYVVQASQIIVKTPLAINGIVGISN